MRSRVIRHGNCRLSRTPAPVMIFPPQNAMRVDGSSSTIVAIDDVPDLVASTVLLLELGGYNAIGAGDGAPTMSLENASVA